MLPGKNVWVSCTRSSEFSAVYQRGARIGRYFSAVLRTKMSVSRILPSKTDVPVHKNVPRQMSIGYIWPQTGTYEMLQVVHISGLSAGRPALRLCPSDFRCRARLSGFTNMQH